MTPVDYAALIKDYGPTGACALLIAALVCVVKWWRGSMNERLADKDKIQERLATALERASSTSQDHTESIKELRDGQAAILKTVTEAALTGAAKDTALLAALGEARAAIERNVGARP